MNWCVKCVLPDTRPNLRLNEEGVCNACLNYRRRQEIDWDARLRELDELVDKARKRRAEYDCIIPVSGGKDSTWQTIKCLELGLRPLAVTWRPPGRTEIGQRNLENLINLGVDHIDFSIDPNIERAFARETFIRAGSPAIPMHLALFAIPLKLACAYRIPLVIWGENSAMEYGDSEASHTGAEMNEAWLRHYGVAHGTSPEDWVTDELPLAKLAAYRKPTAQELAQSEVTPVFLGHFLEWDPVETAQAATSKGFSYEQGGARTGIYDFADIDDAFIAIHHWMKWYKFGFTRVMDNLSIEIRAGRTSRLSACETIGLVKSADSSTDVNEFCEYVEISNSDFVAYAEKHRDTQIWHRGADGSWVIPDFIVPDIFNEDIE